MRNAPQNNMAINNMRLTETVICRIKKLAGKAFLPVMRDPYKAIGLNFNHF
jgi:hypothetical protein